MADTHQHSALSRFFSNPETGEVVVVQPPNAPLLVWFTASLIRWVFSPDGIVGTALSVVGTLSLFIWSVLEIARGDSPFRRVLGAVVLLTVGVGLLLR